LETQTVAINTLIGNVAEVIDLTQDHTNKLDRMDTAFTTPRRARPSTQTSSDGSMAVFSANPGEGLIQALIDLHHPELQLLRKVQRGQVELNRDYSRGKLIWSLRAFYAKHKLEYIKGHPHKVPNMEGVKSWIEYAGGVDSFTVVMGKKSGKCKIELDCDPKDIKKWERMWEEYEM